MLSYASAPAQVGRHGVVGCYPPFDRIGIQKRLMLVHVLFSMWSQVPEVRVHDLKHTFGRRLRAAGVSFEDRQDLLGHKSGRITTHYSAAELHNLIDAANTVSDEKSRTDDFEQEDWLEKVTLTN
jgi:integrase